MTKHFETYFIDVVTAEDKQKVIDGDGITIVRVAKDYARYKSNYHRYLISIVLTVNLLALMILL